MVTRRVIEDEGAKRPRFTRCSSLTRRETNALAIPLPTYSGVKVGGIGPTGGVTSAWKQARLSPPEPSGVWPSGLRVCLADAGHVASVIPGPGFSMWRHCHCRSSSISAPFR